MIAKRDPRTDPRAEPGNHGQNLDELVVVLLSEVSRLSLEVAALKRNRL